MQFVYVCELQDTRACSRVFCLPANVPGNRTPMGREEWRTAASPNHPRGIPRAREGKKITGAARITTAMTDPPRASLKISLPFFSFFFYSLLLLFRLIVENVRRTKMMSRGTLDTLAYFRVASSVCSAVFPRSSALPSHGSSYVHSLPSSRTRNE